MQSNSVDAIIPIFLTIPGIRLNKKENLSLGNDRVRTEDIFHYLLSRLKFEQQSILHTAHAKVLEALIGRDPETTHQFETLLKDRLREIHAAPKRRVDFQANFDETVPVPLSKIRIIRNVENLEESFLYDPDSGLAYTVERRHIWERMSAHIPDKTAKAQWLEDHSDNRVLRYKPYKQKTFEDELGRTVFNKWTSPTYMLEDLDAAYTEAPEDFLKVFNHLFVEESERKYVLAWMRAAIFSRSKAALILTGAPGSGKGVFSEHILSQLVGTSNWTKATSNFESSEFHGDLRGKLVFVLNELAMTKRTKDKIKDFVDGKGALNEKNMRVAGTEDIYASFIIANNYPQNNFLEYSDRKFYVPQLSDVKLDDALTEAWVTNFCEVTCKDVNFLRHLASYLYYHVEPISNYPKTELFLKICELCTNRDFKSFLMFCRNRQSFSEKDMKKSKLDFYQLRSLLEIHEKETKQKVADLHEGLQGWSAVSHIYTEASQQSKDDNDAKFLAEEKSRLNKKLGSDQAISPDDIKKYGV